MRWKNGILNILLIINLTSTTGGDTMNTSISYEGLEPIEELELDVLSPAKINEIIQKVNRLIELRNELDH